MVICIEEHYKQPTAGFLILYFELTYNVKELNIFLSLRFNCHFPGESGLAGVYWSKGWWRWWVVTSGAISRTKPQSNHHHQQTNVRFFTGRMPFLSPNQQCQSTEELNIFNIDIFNPVIMDTMGYWWQRADERHGNSPPSQPGANSGQRQSWKSPGDCIDVDTARSMGLHASQGIGPRLF